MGNRPFRRRVRCWMDRSEGCLVLLLTSSQVAATVVASGWAKMVRNTAATMPMSVGVGLGHQGEQVAGEVHPAALVRRSLEGALERGDEAGVLVGDHQPHPAESALLQVGQERPSEHLIVAGSSESPTSRPSTSRPPSAVIPVATATAIETTWEVALRTWR